VLFKRSLIRGRPLSVLITDIDRFKAVNDTYGHDAGDQVLKEFASRIRSTVRGADLACRYGGEEFVVVMPDTPGEVAASIAERLRMAVETVPFTLRDSGQVLNVTASFGLSSRIGTVETADQLIKQADLALYAAKNSGRNRVVAAAA
jgi:two-component system cell cycle response regulator